MGLSLAKREFLLEGQGEIRLGNEKPLDDRAVRRIRDDGDRCLLVWSSLCEVGDDPLADEFLAAASAALQRTIELAAVAAETAAT